MALIKVANKITMNLYQNLLFSKQALIKVANKKTINLDQYLLFPNYALIKVANKNRKTQPTRIVQSSTMQRVCGPFALRCTWRVSNPVVFNTYITTE